MTKLAHDPIAHSGRFSFRILPLLFSLFQLFEPLSSLGSRYHWIANLLLLFVETCCWKSLGSVENSTEASLSSGCLIEKERFSVCSSTTDSASK